MSLHSNIKLTGRLLIKKYNKQKELVYQTEVPNLVVNAGKALIASRIISNTDDYASHMAVGDNITGVLATQTELVNEVAREAFDSTPSITAADITFTTTFGPGVEFNLKEAGLFNDASAGTMLCRTTFPPINKLSAETVVIAWTVTIG